MRSGGLTKIGASGFGGRRVRGGDSYSWPVAAGESGAEVDLSVLPEWGTPSEIVYIKDLSKGFLAGPKASFVTGAEYMVDGGLLAALGVRLPEDDIIDGGMFEDRKSTRLNSSHAN